MENHLHTVGARVEKFCAVCDEQGGHIVTSITKQGKISRVECAKCGTRGTYKVAAALARKDDLHKKTHPLYAQSNTYRTGQVMNHPSFGVGQVMTVFNTRTIDVLFDDRVRRLVHSRN